MKIQGILPINKPRGKTSFYLVGALRRLFDEKTVGHAGTLDPFATGVMILMVGREFTKRSDQFLGQEKEYVARLKLGVVTDTFDCDGIVVSTSELIPSLEQVQECVAKFQGTIEQIPPMFSAKKVGGKKLYELARAGKTIERQPVLLDVKTEIVAYSYPYLDIKVICSKGTYIRSIAHDMGAMLGCGAHLTHLVRTRSGAFHLDQCLDWNLFSLQPWDKNLFSVTEEGIIQPVKELLCKSSESLIFQNQ